VNIPIFIFLRSKLSKQTAIPLAAQQSNLQIASPLAARCNASWRCVAQQSKIVTPLVARMRQQSTREKKLIAVRQAIFFLVSK